MASTRVVSYPKMATVYILIVAPRWRLYTSLALLGYESGHVIRVSGAFL